MSSEFHPIDYSNKAKFYAELRAEITAMLETVWFTNLANASASLMTQLPDLNWAGFYLLEGRELILGPFQGRPACLRIPLGRGVCGKAAESQASVVVPDVHAFPGHITCDARSRSELVVPLVTTTGGITRVLGVLDLDSPLIDRFTEEDRLELEKITLDLVRASRWPQSFFN
jgi:L-methionine (R)-S-oxide reductase